LMSPHLSPRLVPSCDIQHIASPLQRSIG
jgi:hypothetical protein